MIPNSLYILPDDVLFYICDLLNLSDKRSLGILHMINPFLVKLKKEYISIIKIQRFYRSTLPRLPYLSNTIYSPNLKLIHSKKQFQKYILIIYQIILL